MVKRLEVARLAGVSPSTVSRVINNNGYVAEDVRKRVKQVIEELDYVPNRIAQSLRKQKCHQIACITASIRNSFYYEMIAGVEETALENGFTFSLCQMTFEKHDYLKTILEGFYDGIILLAPFEVEKFISLDEIANYKPTSVYCDRNQSLLIPNVFINLRKAMRKNVEHLIRLGHRDIVFLGYEFNQVDENPRYQGYEDAMHAHGFPIQPHFKQFIPNLLDTVTMGYQKIIEFLEQNKHCTAVVASNDLLAFGAIRAVFEKGLRIPDDISITGVDDIETAKFITPNLTTISIPKKEIGNLLMRQLLDQINGTRTVHSMIEVSSDLVIRESVAKVRKKD